MKNIILKTSLILLVALIIFSFEMGVVNANPVDGFAPANTIASDSVYDVSGKVLGMIQIVGTAIAIIMLTYLGIKYVIAAPDEKANIKQTSTIYFFGAIILFGAVNITKFIYDIIQGSLK